MGTDGGPSVAIRRRSSYKLVLSIGLLWVLVGGSIEVAQNWGRKPFQCGNVVEFKLSPSSAASEELARRVVPPSSARIYRGDVVRADTSHDSFLLYYLSSRRKAYLVRSADGRVYPSTITDVGSALEAAQRYLHTVELPGCWSDPWLQHPMLGPWQSLPVTGPPVPADGAAALGKVVRRLLP